VYQSVLGWRVKNKKNRHRPAFRVSESGFHDGIRDSDFMIWVSGYGFRVSGSRNGVSSCRFRVEGSGDGGERVDHPWAEVYRGTSIIRNTLTLRSLQ
jgi:hypothetical protein